MLKEEIIRALAEGQLSRDELSNFDLTYEEKEDLETITKMMDQARDWTVTSERRDNDIWYGIENRMNSFTSHSADRPARERPAKIWYWMAASIVVLLGFFLVQGFVEGQIEQAVTAAGQTQEVKLPDGSRVVLNANSELTYTDNSNFSDDRNVRLHGEANFSVVPESEFTVVTGSVLTKVIGTNFNVYHRDNQVEIKCIEGEVQVMDELGKKFVLTAGIGIKGSNNQLEDSTFQFEVDKATSWIKGEFNFNKVKLSKVVAEIERQFDVQVLNHKDDNRIYTGSFTNNNLEEALELVLRPMGYDYKILKDKVYIR